jgi:predicted outer membrane repeat protein
VRDSSNISLLGDTIGSTVIDCDGRLAFTFINVTNLTIANIEFVQCGTPIDFREILDLEMQTDLIPPGTKAAHFLVNIHMLFMINASISESHGYGLLCVNMHDESHIVKTNFTINHRYSSKSPVGGAIFLLYADGVTCPSEATWISMMSNMFFHNFVHDRTYKHTKASCLVMVIKQTRCPIHVGVHRSVFDHNYVPIVAIYDLNMWISYEIVIQDSNFTNSLVKSRNNPITATIVYTNHTTVNTLLSGNKLTLARGIHIRNCVFSDTQFTETMFGYIDVRLLFNITIIIEKCIFLPNIFHSAIAIRHVNNKKHSAASKFISIIECKFTDLNFNAIFILSNNDEQLNIKITNSVFRNISTKVLSIYKRPPSRNDKLSIFVENTTFIHNKHYSLHAFQINNLTIAGSKFIENDGTPIVCEGSKIYFSGTTYVTGNKGYNGGALLVSTAVYYYRHSNNWKLSPSVLYFHPKSRLILMNNKASNKGGAIYADISNLNNLFGSIYDANRLNYKEPCFYQLAPVNKLWDHHRNKSTHVPITMPIFAVAFFLFLIVVAYHLFKLIKSTISKIV